MINMSSSRNYGMKEEIKVFGDKAKQIKEGDIFKAVVGSVEGRIVVTLVPTTVDEEVDRDQLLQDAAEQYAESLRDTYD